MSDVTTHLGLPLIAAGQAQKHVTHNEALTLLDSLVQLACLDKDLTAPPKSPAEGDRYLVASSAPTGAWAGRSGQVVTFTDGVWVGLAPSAGWLAYVADEKLLYVFDGKGWVTMTSSTSQSASTDRLGVNTVADSTNRLAVKSDAAVFAWDDVTPGTGDMRITLNKKQASKDAGFVFQNGWSSRALFGTLGGDDFVLKTSPDGSTFLTALTAAAGTGIVTFAASPTAPTPASADNSTRLATTAYVDRAVGGSGSGSGSGGSSGSGSGAGGSRTPVADADYAVAATDRTVAIKSLSVSRKLTLPKAAAFPQGTTLTVMDEAGVVTPSKVLTVWSATNETINGAAKLAMTVPYGTVSLQSDGTSRWTVVGRNPPANRSTFIDVAMAGNKQSTDSVFGRISLQNVRSDAGSNWDSTNNWYVCPRAGVYSITANLRIDNFLTSVVQYGYGVYTNEEDGYWFLWHFSGTGKAVRSTYPYTRMTYQNAGDKLRMFCFTDPPTPIIDAGLQILLVSEGSL